VELLTSSCLAPQRQVVYVFFHLWRLGETKQNQHQESKRGTTREADRDERRGRKKER
jgi:hypothetical protein